MVPQPQQNCLPQYMQELLVLQHRYRTGTLGGRTCQVRLKLGVPPKGFCGKLCWDYSSTAEANDLVGSVATYTALFTSAAEDTSQILSCNPISPARADPIRSTGSTGIRCVTDLVERVSLPEVRSHRDDPCAVNPHPKN